jgi:hypothetical protein
MISSSRTRVGWRTTFPETIPLTLFDRSLTSGRLLPRVLRYLIALDVPFDIVILTNGTLERNRCRRHTKGVRHLRLSRNDLPDVDIVPRLDSIATGLSFGACTTPNQTRPGPRVIPWVISVTTLSSSVRLPGTTSAFLVYALFLIGNDDLYGGMSPPLPEIYRY